MASAEPFCVLAPLDPRSQALEVGRGRDGRARARSPGSEGSGRAARTLLWAPRPALAALQAKGAWGEGQGPWTSEEKVGPAGIPQVQIPGGGRPRMEHGHPAVGGRQRGRSQACRVREQARTPPHGPQERVVGGMGAGVRVEGLVTGCACAPLLWRMLRGRGWRQGCESLALCSWARRAPGARHERQ